MARLFWFTEEQIEKMKWYFPKERGKRRVSDQRVLSGIVWVLKTGCRWKDAPAEYGPYKTLFNRFSRWAKLGVFKRIFAGLSGDLGEAQSLLMDSTYCKAHRTACSLKKGRKTA
jgi:transposase